MKIFLLLFIGVMAFATMTPEVAISYWSKTDFDLTADPAAPQWAGIPALVTDLNNFGKPVPGYRTEIRSRWTSNYLYVLFVCHYEKLHLKPNPVTNAETLNLWDWDVAEMFIGADFTDILHYREFELSPRGEWVDLDIHRDHMNGEVAWKWQSGFKVMGRIDREHKIWYGEMKIPFASIDSRPPTASNQLRANFYRCQGAGPDRKYICWRPTGTATFHTPKAFGRLLLVK